MSGDVHVQFYEQRWGKFLTLTHLLRFMATIKTKTTTASQLFKRLNSYAKDHYLYRALREFGRIIKSVSVISWRHVNLQGEYDFTNVTTNHFQAKHFDMEKILKFKVA